MNNARQSQDSPVRSRTLEYKQAMKDFHTMFPTLERDVIECVLRSNAGHVDSTIDQLLQLTQDNDNRNIQTFERIYYTFDERIMPVERLSPELHDRLAVNDEDPLPPRYTPHFEPPPSPYKFSDRPVEPIFSNSDLSSHLQVQRRRFRDWNPPLLGALPHDFLRLVPLKQSNNSTKQSLQTTHSAPVSRVPKQQQQLSRPTPSQQRSVRSSQKVHSPKHKPLQRRKTTGEVNVVLSSDRSPHQRMVMIEPRNEKPPSNHRRQHSQSNTSTNSSNSQRRATDESQYVEDRRIALLLQNEEFMRELRRNERFLHQLNEGKTSNLDNQTTAASSREKFQPISVDPLKELPSTNARSHAANNVDLDENPAEDKAFKESLRHMNKSAKRSFYEMARRFYARRKSYKSMNDTVDPVFLNCDDDDERR